MCYGPMASIKLEVCYDTIPVLLMRSASGFSPAMEGRIRIREHWKGHVRAAQFAICAHWGRWLCASAGENWGWEGGPYAVCRVPAECAT